MSREVSPSSPAELAGGPAKDEVDPELLSLPDPPKRGRTLTVLVLAAAAIVSLAMAYTLRSDVLYALAPTAQADIGDLRTADAPTLAKHQNSRVTARGMLGAGGAISYERPFLDGSFRALPVAGRDDAWVEIHVPEGKENGRWEPPRSFSGRLVHFGAAGPRHRGLASAIEATTKLPIPSDAWLLVDGEGPSSSRWSVGLAAVFLAFAMWNVGAVIRLVRKVK